MYLVQNLPSVLEIDTTNSSQLDRQKKRDILPKGKSGREAIEWNISFHIETIINQNDELENKFSYQTYHLL